MEMWLCTESSLTISTGQPSLHESARLTLSAPSRFLAFIATSAFMLERKNSSNFFRQLIELFQKHEKNKKSS